MMMQGESMFAGELFAQRKGGLDHFAVCHVTLFESLELTVEAKQACKKQHFDRGISLEQISKVSLHRKKHEDGDLFIIRLETLGEAVLHLLSNDETEAFKWKNELDRCVRNSRRTKRVQEMIEKGEEVQRFLDSVSNLESEEGAWVASRWHDGELLLHHVCRWLGESGSIDNKMVTALERILAFYPEAVRTRSRDGALPFHCFLQHLQYPFHGADAVVEVLLRDDSESIHAKFDDEKTMDLLPIHIASQRLAFPVVQVLLGIDCPTKRMDEFLGEPSQLIARDSSGRTALTCALQAMLETTAQDKAEWARKEGFQVVTLLCSVEPGAVMAKDLQGESALHLAARLADARILQCLMETCEGSNAWETMKNTQGDTPLQILLKEQRRCQLCGDRLTLFNVESSLAVVRLWSRREALNIQIPHEHTNV